MGSFIDTVKRVVKWIGGCISKVISWWRSFRDAVDQKTINYIVIYKTVILNADNPDTFGEVMAINKQKSELEIIAQRKYLSLSERDKESIDSLLANKDY